MKPLGFGLAVIYNPASVKSTRADLECFVNTSFGIRNRYLLALLAALLVALSGLGLGFFMDDYLLMLGVEGTSPMTSRFDLYRFADGNPANTRVSMEIGPLPWFTLPELKVRFMRPLTCATMVIDRALFGRNAVLFHAHSILWYLVVVALVGLIFRRTLPGGLGAFALLLFAFDEAHWFPAAWWANRNALVATAPALLGLVFHLRWREDGWRPGLPLSLIGYAIGLLGGETALGVFGYLFAYEMAGHESASRRSLSNRILALAPAAGIGLVYIVAYKIGGFGAYGSGIYLDPSREPFSYLVRLPVRLLLMTSAHFFSLPVEAGVLWAPAYVFLTAISVVLVGAALLAMRHIWSTLSASERIALRWLLLGAFVASLPVSATFPAGRLLLLPSIGGAAAIAVLIRAGWRKACPPKPWRRLLAGVLILLHLIIAPLMWPVMTVLIRGFAQKSLAVIEAMNVHPAQGIDQEVILLSAGDPVLGFYPLIVRMYQGEPLPRHIRALSIAPFDINLTRTATNAFEMEVIDGELITSLFEQLLRDRRFPMKAGDTVTLEGIRIEVLAVGKQGPTRILCIFDAPLEDPRYAFLTWDSGSMKRVTLPPVGESMRLAHTSTFQY